MNPIGNGLGLKISKNIAKCLKGDLTCKSTLGFGSTFSFIFEADPVKMAIKNQKSLKTKKLKPSRRKESIDELNFEN